MVKWMQSQPVIVRRIASSCLALLVLAVCGCLALTMTGSVAMVVSSVNSIQATRIVTSSVEHSGDSDTADSKISLSQELAAQSFLYADRNMDLAMLLAVEAHRFHDSPLTRSTVLNLLQRSPHLYAYLQGHTTGANVLAFSPDGSILAIGGEDQTVTLWDTTNGTMLGSPLLGHTQSISAIAFSPDGRLIATAGYDSNIFLWETETRERHARLTTKNYVATQLFFSPDSQKLIAQSTPQTTLAIWDIAGEVSTEHILSTGISLNANAVLDSGNAILISYSAQNEVVRWDAATGNQIAQPITSLSESVVRLAVSPSGKVVALGDVNGAIQLLDISAQPPASKVLNRHTGEIRDLEFSRDGKYLASLDSDGSLLLWDLGAETPTGKMLLSSKTTVLAIDPSGKALATGDRSGTITLWELSTGQALGKPLVGHGESISYLAFSPDGQRLVSSDYHKVILWNVSTEYALARQIVAPTGVDDLAINSSGDTMAIIGCQQRSAGCISEIHMLDTSTGATIGKPFEGVSGMLWNIAFSKDGSKLVASGCYNEIAFCDQGEISFWDLKLGEMIGEPIVAHKGAIWSIDISHSGSMLASGSDDGILLWDINSRERIGAPFIDTTGPTWSVAFSPDDLYLASGSWDSNVVLWDTRDGNQLGRMALGSQTGVYSVAFSPDGTVLASSNWAKTASIILWDVATFKMNQPQYRLITAGDDLVFRLAFSPNGNTLAAGGNNHSIALWDVATLASEGQLSVNEADYNVSALAFSPDGNTLISSDDYGNIILWDLNPDSWDAHACRIAGRNLTQAEWMQFLPKEAYHQTCSSYP